MGSKGRGYPAGITGPVREPAPTKPEVVGIGQDRQIPHVASIYVGESAVFPIIFYPADYVSAISDYSCTTPGVNLSLDPDLDNYLRVEFTEQVQPDTNIPIYFKNQLIMNVTSVEQIPEVTEVLKKVGDDWIPVTEVAIAVDEGEDIWVKFSNPDYKPKASQFSVSPLTDDVSISVVTTEEDEGAFVSIEVFGEQAYGAKVQFLDHDIVSIVRKLPSEITATNLQLAEGNISQTNIPQLFGSVGAINGDLVNIIVKSSYGDTPVVATAVGNTNSISIEQDGGQFMVMDKTGLITSRFSYGSITLVSLVHDGQEIPFVTK